MASVLGYGLAISLAVVVAVLVRSGHANWLLEDVGRFARPVNGFLLIGWIAMLLAGAVVAGQGSTTDVFSSLGNWLSVRLIAPEPASPDGEGGEGGDVDALLSMVADLEGEFEDQYGKRSPIAAMLDRRYGPTWRSSPDSIPMRDIIMALGAAAAITSTDPADQSGIFSVFPADSGAPLKTAKSQPASGMVEWISQVREGGGRGRGLIGIPPVSRSPQVEVEEHIVSHRHPTAPRP